METAALVGTPLRAGCPLQTDNASTRFSAQIKSVLASKLMPLIESLKRKIFPGLLSPENRRFGRDLINV